MFVWSAFYAYFRWQRDLRLWTKMRAGNRNIDKRRRRHGNAVGISVIVFFVAKSSVKKHWMRFFSFWAFLCIRFGCCIFKKNCRINKFIAAHDIQYFAILVLNILWKAIRRMQWQKRDMPTEFSSHKNYIYSPHHLNYNKFRVEFQFFISKHELKKFLHLSGLKFWRCSSEVRVFGALISEKILSKKGTMMAARMMSTQALFCTNFSVDKFQTISIQMQIVNKHKKKDRCNNWLLQMAMTMDEQTHGMKLTERQ